jgi:hypothetical protein
MPEQAINIRIRLTDEVSKNLKDVSNKVEDFGKKIRSVGKQFSQIGAILTMAGAGLTAPLVLAFRESAKYSLEMSKSMSELGAVMQGFSASIGNSVSPSIKQLTQLLNGLLNAWNSINPKTREAIVNFMFWGGIMLTTVGTISFFIGKVLSLAGNIGILIGKMGQWIATNIGIKASLVGGIGAGLIALIFLMLRFKEVGSAVMNGLEITIKGLSVGFWEVVQSIAKAMLWLGELEEKFFKSFSDKLPKWLGKEQFEQLTGRLNEANLTLKAFIDDVENSQMKLSGDINDILSGSEGQWAEWLDGMRNKVDEFMNAFKLGTQQSVDVMFQWGDYLKNQAQQVVKAMSNSLGDFFYNTFKGQLNSAQEAFANFGNIILQTISQIIAQIMVVTMLKKMGLGFLIMHQGGVVKAHSGYLANDEVPIVAQSGEGVLSRRGMRALGNDNFARLNRGQGIGGSQIVNQPVVVIQAWDTSDLIRNRKSIEAIIANAMRTNSDLRGEMKKYG